MEKHTIKSSKITPVLLAGGNGTRLWPLSRRSYPKQFSALFEDKSLFQKAAKRFVSTRELSFNSCMVLTHRNFRFIVADQLLEIGLDPGSVLIEPEQKDTASAILAASIYAMKNSENAILLIAPCDHSIDDTEQFHSAIISGLSQVENGKIVTFGVKPTRPETGYGYLKLSEEIFDQPVDLDSFVEKPNIETARKMIASENYLWNSGIFMFKAKDMLAAGKKFLPKTVERLKSAIELGKEELGFFTFDEHHWSECEKNSIDYAIMEKLDNLSVVPLEARWSDLGDWAAILSENEVDKNGVAISGNATVVNCKNSLFRTESEAQHLVGIGVQDIIAVATQDAVLVTHKDSAQGVKEVVTKLRDKNIPQATSFPKEYKPWGWYETLSKTTGFQVKKIFVKPGEALSLQSHYHRSEHWIVVKGTAKVTIESDVMLVSEGESVYIPLGATHRMENPGLLPMLLVEVQTGSYLEEDDIVRYDDKYKR